MNWHSRSGSGLPNHRRRTDDSATPSPTRKIGLYAQRLLLLLVLFRFIVYCFWMHSSLNIPEASVFQRTLLDVPTTLHHYARLGDPHENDLKNVFVQNERRNPIEKNNSFLPHSALKWIHHTSVEDRQQRTRPRLNQTVAPPTTPIVPWNTSTIIKETIDLELLMNSNKATQFPKYHWSHLCKQAGLNARSNVIITGVFSHPPAMGLALLLVQHCQVETIMGIDSLFPNRRRERMRYMKDYRLLQKRVKNFQLVVPDVGVTIDGKIDILVKFQPSHVIHMETALPCHWQLNMDEPNLRMFTTQNGLLSLQEILELTRHRSYLGEKTPIRVIHVTSQVATWQNLLSSILTVTYSASTSNISFTHLQLPGAVVGPFVPNYLNQGQNFL